MSMPENDSKMLNTILTNTDEDFSDFVPNFMYFFTPDELRPTIPSFENNLKIITNELSVMKEYVTNEKYQNLKNHGLSEQELKRKYEMYIIVRNDYHSKKHTFVNYFVELGKKMKASGIELKRNGKDFLSKVKDLPASLKEFYKTTRDKFRELKISKERFYEFLNSILKSIADALGIGGIVSEYKDSIEIATKKENSIQFNVVVFQLGPELFEKMEIYAKNQSSSTPLTAK